MAKITLRLDTRRRKDDSTYPLKVAIHRNNKTLYIPLGLYLFRDEWDNNRCEVVKRKDRRAINVYLNNKITELNAKLFKLQMEGRLRALSDRQLISILAGGDDAEQPNMIKPFFAQFITSISNKRTRELYEATEKKIISFRSNYKDLTFEDITMSWLRSFDAFMAQGNRVNSRSIHMRNLRAVFNAAINEGLTANYPFRRFKIKSQQTAKRALTREQLLRLMNADVNEFQRKYIDMFFFGFYLIGINMVDMAALTQIRDGRIEYERAKTHKLYNIKVEPEALSIIDKYRGNKKLLSFFENAENYRCVANRQNTNLKKIGIKIGIDDLTYYCARHSWATMAAELDISEDTIAMALGHTRSTVTDVYIRRNYEKVDKANRRVIDYLLSGDKRQNNKKIIKNN